MQQTTPTNAMQAHARESEPTPPASGRRPASTTSRRRFWADRFAAWLVTAGGMAIIAGILGILVFIVAEIVPLLRGAQIETGAELRPPSAVLAAIGDEHRTHTAMLGTDGTIRVVALESGTVVQELAPAVDPPLTLTAAAAAPGQQTLTGATDDGRVLGVSVEWEESFVGDQRRIDGNVAQPIVFEMDPAGRAVEAYSVRLLEDGSGLAVAQLTDGTLVVLRCSVTVNMMTDERTEDWSRDEIVSPGRLAALQLDADGLNLYAATADGDIVWWRASGARFGEPQVLANDEAPVTALTLLIGDRSLITGHEDGALVVWFPVRQDDDSFLMTRIRDFPPHPGPIRLLSPSMRDKGFLAQDESGQLGLYYSTSRRTLWTGESPIGDATALFFTPKANGALVGGAQSLALLDIDNRHPEISFGSLFGKVWYEGYRKPEHTWQSTGGTDDFESKLSLTPLLVGTMKGTLYSLFLAVPLGVLGAMYTSQFVHPGLRRYIKPTVEIMAALPSVVLGFLAGLWLAPRIENVLVAIFLSLIVTPVIAVASGLVVRSLPRTVRQRLPHGWETGFYMITLAMAVACCVWIGPGVERVLFASDIQAWLLEVTGLQYDQRNAVVVGLAMGFAVIPIIFSIAEDAFSNVPRNLVSGSLALGANRWQTVTRVVLPTASPGIFSAIMIGFGRAIGETMIVLMATGNTPIMDWNPFNGFRTLSANIAVEIPEAPHGATLYRTLFLAALLLFLFTFALNTVGDVVRQRLRKRYAQM